MVYQTAPVVREIVTSAYQAGAKLVDVLWGDADLKLIQYQYAPKESFDDFPNWQAQGVLDVIEDGGAVLTILAFDPSLLEKQDPDLVAREQQTIQQVLKPFSSHISKNKMNWMVLGIPVDGWARKVFPDLPDDERIPALWDALFKVCRVYEDDPIKAWQEHIADLEGSYNDSSSH